MEKIQIIGKVHSSLKDLNDCPLQEHENAPPAELEIFKEFAAAARDIEVGDELVILTWLDRADRKTLTTHPRNDPQTPLTGIFSTRSPDRPNPIGLHIVKVTARLTVGRFEVSGLEVLDQTPVIDVKPRLNASL